MTETESMVVRVAKAILYDFMPHEDAWDLVDESDRSRCRGYARAAIEAMKEPTDAMADDGYRAIAGGADAVWFAMIEAALSPSPSSHKDE